jgi:hypothetical protein
MGDRENHILGQNRPWQAVSAGKFKDKVSQNIYSERNTIMIMVDVFWKTGIFI